MDSANQNPPYFSAIEPRAWTVNRLYRIYIAPGEMVGIWAGSGHDVVMTMAATGGLIGGLLAVAANPARKNFRRSDELDSTPLSELRRDHKHNFALRLDEIDEAEIVPAGFWFRVNYSAIPGVVALLRLRTRDASRRTFALCSADDVARAIDLLQPQLGSNLRADVPDQTKAASGPVNRTPPRSFEAGNDIGQDRHPEAGSKENARRSGSKTLIICLAILGLMLGIGGVALAWDLFFRNRMPENDWHLLQSSQGHFQIQFPEPPQTQRERKSTRAGEVETVTFKKNYDHPEMTFTASYFDATPVAIHEFPLEQRFQGAREGAREVIEGEVISDRAIQLGGGPGKEWHIKGAKTSSVTRMYAIPDGENTRIFILSVAGRDVSPSTPAVGKFLNSFNFSLPDPVEAVATTEAWWKPFYSMEGGFQVSFPGQPERQEQRIEFLVGQVHRIAYTKRFANPIVSFWVDYMDLNSSVARQCPPDRCFRYFQTKMLSQIRGGTMVTDKPIKLGSHPGKECMIAGGGTEVSARMYVVPAGEKTRLFLLMVRGVNIRPAAADVARFFDSFSYKQK